MSVSAVKAYMRHTQNSIVILNMTRSYVKVRLGKAEAIPNPLKYWEGTHIMLKQNNIFF